MRSTGAIDQARRTRQVDDPGLSAGYSGAADGGGVCGGGGGGRQTLRVGAARVSVQKFVAERFRARARNVERGDCVAAWEVWGVLVSRPGEPSSACAEGCTAGGNHEWWGHSGDGAVHDGAATGRHG